MVFNTLPLELKLLVLINLGHRVSYYYNTIIQHQHQTQTCNELIITWNIRD